MPSYTIQFDHLGRLNEAVISADNLDDAYARLESLKATGELDDSELVEAIDADDDTVARAQASSDALNKQLDRVFGKTKPRGAEHA